MTQDKLQEPPWLFVIAHNHRQGDYYVKQLDQDTRNRFHIRVATPESADVLRGYRLQAGDRVRFVGQMESLINNLQMMGWKP